jgi:TonB dependent receptor
MLGLPTNLSGWLGNTAADQTIWWYGGYLQDQWRATRRLTLTAGLRYDYVAPANYHKVVSALDALTGQFMVTQPELPYFPKATAPSGFYYPQYNGYEPRFGIAYHASDRTVIRAAVAKLDDHNNSLVQKNQSVRLSCGVPGEFCTSGNHQRSWYERSLGWHEGKSKHRSRL